MNTELDIEIFVIDDDDLMTGLIGDILTKDGKTNFRLFNDPQELLDNLTENVHICVVDYILAPGQMNGLDLIKKIVQKNRHCWFIMISGQNDLHVLVQFMNSVYGSRYIEKGGAGDITKELIYHINDILMHIQFIENFYLTAAKIKEGFTDLKNLLKT